MQKGEMPHPHRKVGPGTPSRGMNAPWSERSSWARAGGSSLTSSSVLNQSSIEGLLGGLLTSLSGRFGSQLDWPWRVYLEKGLPLSLLVLAPQGHVSAGHGGTALTVDPLVGSNDVAKIT
jgi:hypothetical protein